ncbi:wiskott-Aldrich syndrome protein family member 1-like [Microtus oregoni]|uniref:wiskott-Aldrich syndrome protein family member 1-like n=1 Tax=Microtus oregoni TaxID=111838 RepID=UPI001BB23A1E|nr:wiskott-Aldrich syndrome protein family member 1-like [Microtus oregoni]
MSLNEDKVEQYLSQPQTISKFIYVILTSLNKIVSRVNDLDKHTEDLFGKLDEEIHSISFKLQNLQENIIQLTEVIAHKVPNDVLSMEVWKSRKTLPNITIETQQVYSCTSLPVNIFERNDTNTAIPLLTLPTYYQNDMEDSSSSDGSFHSCLYSSKFVQEIVPENKEQASKKYIQEKNLDHDSGTKTKLQCQLVKERISVDRIPASGCAVSYSYLDQSEGGSSLYIFPLNKSKPQEKSAANNLPGEQEHLHYGIGHMSQSRPRVLYGTGKGDVMLSQPPSLIHRKKNIFVNPLAPEAPPLPSDRLIHLASSKRPSAPRIVSSPVTSSFVVLETTTSACLKTTSKIHLKMPPEFTSTSASHECLELQPGSLSPQSQDQMITSLLSPSVIALNKSWDSALDLIDSAIAVQSKYSICQPVKSFQKSPETAKSSPESASKLSSASGPLPQNQVSNTSGSSSAQLPRSPRVPCSVSVPASSNQKTQMSSNLSPSSKRSVSHLTKLIEAQSKLHMTKSKGHLYSPPPQLSCLTSTKVTTLQSSLPSMKSTSASSHRSLAITQPVNPNPGNQNPSSVLPMMGKARNALMDAIKAGVKLRKIHKERPSAELHENEADMIRDRRRAMGYNSGKSDSESEWA